MYGGAAVDFAYQNPIGLTLTENFFARPTLGRFISRAMGLYQDSAYSTKAIPTFIENYQIPMQEFEEKKYSSFNDFFIRKFKPGLRPFSSDPGVFSAGAEARYLALENMTLDCHFPVKGIRINLEALLGSADTATSFVGGTCLIARLCPVDYHRYHFGTNCSMSKLGTSFKKIHGDYHSVNPVALKARPDLLIRNERHLTLLESELFGTHAMIEVGALGVGKIIQSAFDSSDIILTQENTKKTLKFDKGQEKGYFLFGGSTVIWLFQAGSIRLSDDLIKNSAAGLETWVPLGDKIGSTPLG